MTDPRHEREPLCPPCYMVRQRRILAYNLQTQLWECPRCDFTCAFPADRVEEEAERLADQRRAELEERQRRKYRAHHAGYQRSIPLWSILGGGPSKKGGGSKSRRRRKPPKKSDRRRGRPEQEY